MTQECDYLVSETQWAVMTIMAEARGESFLGKMAVAEVIKNRAKTLFFSDGSICSTVLWPYQFSSWNTTDPNRITVGKLKSNDPIVLECLRAWNKVIGSETDITHGAVMYHAESITPKWVNDFMFTTQIGRHKFYKRIG